jgi:hypothetical protein
MLALDVADAASLIQRVRLETWSKLRSAQGDHNRFPFVLSLSKHSLTVPFDKLRANGDKEGNTEATRAARSHAKIAWEHVGTKRPFHLPV